MFIKKITINGFRSYLETSSLSDLSPGHNVILGPNGCGKTNILNAIQFVLSDEFNGLTANQRQQLINESQSQRLLIAFVEIVIDNSDRRMPLEMNEIVFRRQFGLKKDQYFMNNKIVTHSDIVNLLETAGFSRSNPYYIVKQGKVNEMATASDEYRLQVMREVAGTRIYDQRKREALKLLTESRQRSEQIDDCLKSLEEKLSILQNESHDLHRFLKWDKRRRLLEYIINNKESEQMKDQILKLEEKQRKENKVLEEKRNKLQEIQQKSKNCDKKLKVMSGVVEEYRKDLKEINKSIDELNERKARIESQINDFKEKLNFNKENDLMIINKLKDLKLEIEIKRKRLVFINAKYEELKKEENSLVCKLKEKKSRKLELYSKQKRKESFRTIEERDRWIRSELPKLEKDIETNRKRILELKAEQMAIIKQMDLLEEQQNGFASEEETLLKSLSNEKQELFELNKEIRIMENKRSELWDFENQFKEKEIKLIEDKTKIESRLTKFAGSTAIVSRQTVHKVLDIFQQKASDSDEDKSRYQPIIDGYLGQVIDCFTFDPNLKKAIEVTIKSKLFHHIVETDRIGTKIMAEVNARHMLGDITFIAINKLNVKPVHYTQLGNDARPLISLIKFDKKYEKVMKFLFQRILICRNLEMATKFARNAKLDCVTIDGDFVSHKGLMSGGYFGSETRIELFAIWKKIIENIKSNDNKIKDCSKQKVINEKELISAQNSLAALDIKQNKIKHKLENLKTSKKSIRNQLMDLNVKLESITRSIASLESTLPSMISNKESFESELELSLDSQLSTTEEQELKAILKDIETLERDHSNICERRNKFGTEKSSLETDLDKNLEQRKNEFEFALIDSKILENETLVENESFDVEVIEKRIKALKKVLDEKDSEIDKMIRQKNEQKELLDNYKLAEDKQMDIINTEAKKSRKIAIQLANIEKKNDECLKRLRNLGTIPSDSDTNFQNMSLSEEYLELHKCNRKLSKLTNVNQKALDQLKDGEQKARVLSTEKREIDLGYHSIEKLIESLEHQKYEAIQLTYRQVSQFFTQVFKKLVPEGKAFIDMIYSDNNGSESSQQSSQESQSSGGISATDPIPAYNRIDNFVGVKIRVAFTGTAVIKEMNQLSGGQKSIVALAFIFSIQKCDPAPFYLFDEVDQALDSLYRKALADIIREMSKTSQFISTTFRPELLESADKYFGVKFRNRVSHVQEIDVEVAKEFVSSDDTSERDKTKSRSRSVRFEDTTTE